MTERTTPKHFAILVELVQDRQAFLEEIIQGVELPLKINALLLSSFACFGVYGLIIGASSGFRQALASAVKLPLLYLVTMLICFPTLYFFNVFFGAKQSFRQQFTLLLTAATVISILLVGFAPVTLFFLITANSYEFFKLLNVGVFTITGVIGVTFFYQSMRTLSGQEESGQMFRTRILRLWLLLYAFVGSQLGWTLRPFFGAPNTPFQLFRGVEGNFYLNVLNSLREILGIK